MKRAFTMIELVMVMVVVGILVAVALPRLNRDNVYQAANQVASHIRYAQHLAMQDDKFVPTAAMSSYANVTRRNTEARFWYKGRWQILFFNVAGETETNSFTAYTIFSDSPNTTAGSTQYDGNPNESANFHEVARDPQNPNQFLIGAEHASFTLGQDRINTKLNLRTYGIRYVSFNNCGNARRLAFDNFGRPITGNLRTSTGPYMQARMLRGNSCEIWLCTVEKTECEAANVDDETKRVKIAIDPETGFVHTIP